MKKVVVIYKSVYGTTKQYANWIAEELDAPIFEASDIKAARFADFDIVIYGGGLYAGGINGVKLVSKVPYESLVVFTVGLATPETTDYSDILKKSFSSDNLAKIKAFHLQGGMDYGKLSIVHKAMMAFKKREVEKIPISERTSDDHVLLNTYGEKIDFTNIEGIKPLIHYVRNL